MNKKPKEEKVRCFIVMTNDGGFGNVDIRFSKKDASEWARYYQEHDEEAQVVSATITFKRN